MFFSLGAYGLVICQALIMIGSWLCFSFASRNPDLIYLPLKSYFLPFYTEANRISEIPWLLTWKNFSVDIAHKLTDEVITWVYVIAFTLFFILAIFNQKDLERNSYREITVLSLIFGALAAFSLPADSSDFFQYIARGAQQAFYDQNPFVQVVSDISGWRRDPYLANSLWANNPSPYGPLFMIISKILAGIGSINIWWCFATFKAFFFGIFVTTLAFTYHLLHSFRMQDFIERLPLSPKQLYVLVALNPFLITEIIWNAHNDLIMGLLVLTAAYLLPQKILRQCCSLYHSSNFNKVCKHYFSTFTFLYAIKNKYFPIVGTLISGFFSFTFMQFFDIFNLDFSQLGSNASLSHKSLFDSLNSIFKYAFAINLPDYTKYVALGLFALVFIAFFINRISKEQINPFQDFFIVLFLLLCVFSPKFHSWYLVMLLPLGIFSFPELIMILSFSHLLSLTFIDQANILNFVSMTLIPVAYYIQNRIQKQTRTRLITRA